MQFIIQNIWLIVIIITALAGLGVWWVMTSGVLQRLMDMFNSTGATYIAAKLFCEDKQIRDRKLKVGNYCINDEKIKCGFHLVHDFLITGKNTGKQFLALSPRDSFPIDFHGRMTPEKRKQYPDAQRIYIDTANDIDNSTASEAAKNLMGMSLSIIAMAGALVFIVLAIIVFWQTRGGL